MTETRSERARLVAERARGACEYCGSLVLYSTQSFSIEHIVPLHKGGSSELENLAFSCQGCNGHKYTNRVGLINLRGLLYAAGQHPRPEPSETD